MDIFDAIQRRTSVEPDAFWMMILGVAVTVLGSVLFVVLRNQT